MFWFYLPRYSSLVLVLLLSFKDNPFSVGPLLAGQHCFVSGFHIHMTVTQMIHIKILWSDTSVTKGCAPAILYWLYLIYLGDRFMKECSEDEKSSLCESRFSSQTSPALIFQTQFITHVFCQVFKVSSPTQDTFSRFKKLAPRPYKTLRNCFHRLFCNLGGLTL